MITRIVKMTFEEEKVPDFLKLFEEVKFKIRNFEGCEFLELLQDQHTTNVIFTHSKWESEDALNAYRHSAMFKATWTRTKALFDDRPEAWSTHVISSTQQKEQ